MTTYKKGIAPLALIIIIVVAAAGVGVYYTTSRQDNGNAIPKQNGMENEGDMTPAQNEEEGNGMTAMTHTIEMVASGFSPATLTIQRGDTVQFVNNDMRNRWPASGVHPTHEVCPGFDALRAVAPGGMYSFTFNEAKTCPMHDHLIPTLRGTITVQ